MMIVLQGSFGCVFKAMRALRLSWWATGRVGIMFAIGFLVTKVEEIRQNSHVYRGDWFFFILYSSGSGGIGEFGYYTKKTKRCPTGWRKIAKLGMTSDEATSILGKEVSFFVENCAERVVRFPCGCKEVAKVRKVDKSTDPEGVVCEICGFLHQPINVWERIECSAHKAFFVTWPELKNGNCVIADPPADGISRLYSSSAVRKMLKGEIPMDEEKLKALCRVIRRGKLDCYRLVIGSDNLPSALRDDLVFGVEGRYRAEEILTKRGCVLGSPARRHLCWIIWRSRLSNILVKSVAIVASVFALWWSVPDWRTMIVLLVWAGAWFVWRRTKIWFD